MIWILLIFLIISLCLLWNEKQRSDSKLSIDDTPEDPRLKLK